MQTLVQLLPRPGSGFGELLVCSSLGKNYLSLHGQVKTLAGIINDFFSECKRRLEAQNFPLFPGQISGEVSIGYDEARGLR